MLVLCLFFASVLNFFFQISLFDNSTQIALKYLFLNLLFFFGNSVTVRNLWLTFLIKNLLIFSLN